jgi:hypothetical protein
MGNRRGRRDFGNVRRLPSGRWQATYLGPDAVRRSAPETFPRKQDATRWLSRKQAEIDEGEWRDPAAGDVLLREYAERWIAERPGLRPRTVELYRWLLSKHITPHLGGRRLADLDDNAPAIRAWRQKLLGSGVSATMFAKSYRLLRAVLSTAVEDRVIRRSPCRIKGADKEHAPERPILSPAQVAALAARMPARYSALIMLATYGAR